MAGLSGAEAALLEDVDDQAQPMLAMVEAWAAINTGSRNQDGLAAMAQVLADAFGSLPGEAALLEPQPATSIDADGRETPLVHGRNLHVKVRPDARLQLLFTGHMDTVFAADHPFQSCRWTGPGVLNGPGVADMKGGLAIMLTALQAVERSPAAAAIGYEVVINSDEEVSSLGSAHLIAAAARGKAAAFTYEPALPDGALAGARPGSGNFSIIVTGRAAHAGRNPEEGRNAVVAAADLAVRLAAAAGDELKVNPARVDGGGPNNIVPDCAVLRVNLRPATAEAEQEAKSLIARLVDDVAARHEVSVDVHGGFARPPKPLDAKAEGLFRLVRACGLELGLDIAWRATGGVCDGNNIAAMGVPVVDTMGARGGAIHSTDEFLIVESLVERARLSALAIMRMGAGEWRA